MHLATQYNPRLACFAKKLMHNCMACTCTSMPEAQPDQCVAHQTLVCMLSVHVTKHVCDAADGDEGSAQLRDH